ncbi:MAG: GNAT family N-acetyltransferase [Myxococcales bacterium]|nr:GNAT family N-acetyltransferase [Myxococcales bacterium]
MRLPLPIDGYEIRSFARGDGPALVRHASSRNVWRNLKDRFPHPYTDASAAWWLDQALHQNPETNFAVATARELAGGIGVDLLADVHSGVGEIGYWLGERHWGRGVMSAAVAVFVPWAFAHLDLRRIQAGVFEGNEASARLLVKAGFTLEGRMRAAVVKDGRVLDQLLYARLRDDEPTTAFA